MTNVRLKKCSTVTYIHGHNQSPVFSKFYTKLSVVCFDSPSVLDRLNGLLEPGGMLSINERGVVDGDIPVVKPHPDFRWVIFRYTTFIGNIFV